MVGLEKLLSVGGKESNVENGVFMSTEASAISEFTEKSEVGLGLV